MRGAMRFTKHLIGFDAVMSPEVLVLNADGPPATDRAVERCLQTEALDEPAAGGSREWLRGVG
jgi:hypothetical protein